MPLSPGSLLVFEAHAHCRILRMYVLEAPNHSQSNLASQDNDVFHLEGVAGIRVTRPSARQGYGIVLVVSPKDGEFQEQRKWCLQPKKSTTFPGRLDWRLVLACEILAWQAGRLSFGDREGYLILWERVSDSGVQHPFTTAYNTASKHC